jgi:hypothetical protein
VRRKVCSLGGLPSGTPDCLSLPGSFLCFTAGSSFQARYVPFGSLFREPLGTISTMHQKPNRVNRNRLFSGPDRETLFALFSLRYDDNTVKTLCIKRERSELFFFTAPDRMLRVTLAAAIRAAGPMVRDCPPCQPAALT